MDVSFLTGVIHGIGKGILMLLDDCRESLVDEDFNQSKRIPVLFYVIAVLLSIVIFYQYLKYLLVFNAYQYEKFVKKRCGHLRKLSKQLRNLSKGYGNLYFCYMPMDHGINLPPTYSLFMAIKEVLMNSNRPCTRVLRTNLLQDLVHGDLIEEENPKMRFMNLREENVFQVSPDEMDPLFEYNFDIMQCSRELIIQGVKDFDLMTTIYQVMESVTEEE